MDFKQLEIKSQIHEAIEEIGFENMTEIQAQSIPLALQNKDILGQAQTGTGKTASFVIPILNQIEINSELQALILAPTRELAVQITEEIKKFGKYLKVNCISIYGGDPIERQLKLLKTGPQIVVGTPGRTIDLMNRKKLKLHNIQHFALDEVDEMLNMGFIDDVEIITQKLPKTKQTLLYSATMPSRIKKICDTYLNDPVHVKVKAKSLTVDKVSQSFMICKNSLKPEVVRDIILLRKNQKIILFVQTKRSCDEMFDYLNKQGLRVAKIHGDIVQQMRLRTIAQFRENQFEVLIATDVVARGIDIDNVDLVINMELPQDREYYIHRIGRTGRGKSVKGEAISVITPNEHRKEFRHYEKYLNCTIAEIKRPSKQDIITSLLMSNYNKIDTHITNSEIEEAYLSLTHLLLDNHNEKVIIPHLLAMLLPELSAKQSSADTPNRRDDRESDGRSRNRNNRGGSNRSGSNNRSRDNRTSRSSGGKDAAHRRRQR